MSQPRIDIVKRGGRPDEEFDLEKLHSSVVMTCLSVRTPEGQADDVARQVTLGVMRWCEARPQITSADIRRQVTRLLQPLHPEAAYVYEHHKTMI